MRNIVRAGLIILALGFTACDDTPTTPSQTDGETVFDPSFDVDGPPDGGTCPNVYYEESELLDNGVTVTWTSVLAGFDYTEGADYVGNVMWSVDMGAASFVDFTTRRGRNTWTPRGPRGSGVDGAMTPGAAGDGTIPVTVSMTPMHEAGNEESDDDGDEEDDWAGKKGTGHFWLRLEIDDGEDNVERVKLGVNFHLEDPADGFDPNCPDGDGTDDPPADPPANQPPAASAGDDQTVTDADDSGSEDVMIDGTSSVDPDGSIVN